ncbi:myelin-associated glycoprotein-like [Chaetodon trifascialis]|uniref:myelin-associated glycoprotein-like n=1 Tax=Chaetodon trifascialis TaxID=109706 RepID=UPI00399202E5
MCPVEGETYCLQHRNRMFVFIWTAVLFSLRGSNADTGGSGEQITRCQGRFCISLIDGEITAEAGLCVVIPCFFYPGYGFDPQHMIWYKCEPVKEKCGDSDMIFHTNKNSKKVQSGYKGRVSLLEPDVSKRDCSIVVNDLTESDSGVYQLRVNGLLNWRPDGFTFSPRATVSVKDLIQKPTVMIPPLTEGQQTTLTCTAPGLCSGSYPEITWTWSGAGGNDFHITGNITAFKTEDLTSVAQRHSSTLTFNSSAEHHGSNVTCKVSFANNITTEETVTLNVTYVKDVKITGNAVVKEGETLSLTCSVESFPPSLITWTKYSAKHMQNGTEDNLQNETSPDLQNETSPDLQNETSPDLQNETSPDLQNETSPDLQNETSPDLQNETSPDLHNDTETYLKDDSVMGIFSISNVTAEHSGQYICTAKHLNSTLMKKVDVKVMFVRKPVITGLTIVKEGGTLNLTCSVQSFPPSAITWTMRDCKTNLHNVPHTDPGSGTLVIHNVTVEHSGQYICTALHLQTTVAVFADVTVTRFPKIINSGCKVQSEVLTCVCTSDGFPLPTVNWPLLMNHTKYSLITTVSDHTVNSTVTLTVKDHRNTVVECVSSNQNGEAKENLDISIDVSQPEGQFTDTLKTVSWLEIILAFLIGVLLTAVLCCLAKKCHRKKQSSGNLEETLEMGTNQEDPLIDIHQAVEDDQTYYQEAAEEGEAVAAEKAALDLDGGPKDVEYASIDFSLLKRKSPREAAKKQEATETEYAEIKKEAKEEREDNGREEGEALEGKEEEEMMGEGEEATHVPEEEQKGDVATYSSVKDVMDEI